MHQAENNGGLGPSMKRLGAAAVVVAVYVLIDAPAAMAQIVQSDAAAEPGSSETTQLVTSSTEVRRAVMGLLVIAGVVGLISILYWYKTGQQARDRFASLYGGRHLAGQGDHDVVEPSGRWATDAAHTPSAFAQPVYANPPTHPPAAGHAPQAPPMAPHPAGHQPGPVWNEPGHLPQPSSLPTWETQQPAPAPAPRRRPEFHE